MFDNRIDTRHDRSNDQGRWLFRLAIICLLSFHLAGCDEGSADTVASPDATGTGPTQSASADPASFDSSLADRPCEVIPPEIVAQAFAVPQDKLEQSHVDFVSSQCSYELEGDKQTLGVTLSAEVYDTADKAAKAFRNSTRSMSADEISDAMAAIKDQAKKSGKLDTAAKREAAGKTAKNLAPRGIHFEDVHDVADQARFQTDEGTLYLRQGNLRISLTAYHGPDMPLPETISAGSMLKAGKAWRRKTMAERKRQVVKLAKAIIAAL